MAVWNLKNPAEMKAIESLTQESDRGVAIVAATFLEDRLTQGLICRFRRDTGKAKDMIDNLVGIDGALGAFTSKIKLGYLLRVYGKQVHNELIAIKDIRNKFAHVLGESALISFEHPDIIKFCNKLTIIENYQKHISELPDGWPLTKSAVDAVRQSGMGYDDNPQRILGNPRLRFVETCGLLSERFQHPDQPRDPQLPDEFLILGDEPYPLP